VTSPQRGADRRQSVQSVEVGFGLFIALADVPEGASLSVLAGRAGMPAAKAHRYLKSLIATGLAEQDPGTGRYGLGPAALRVGVAALARIGVARAAARPLAALRDATGQTCFLAVPGEAGPTVVVIEAGAGSVIVNIRLGSTLPEHSASGQVQRAWADPPPPALAAVRAAGLAAVEGTVLPGVSALAAPVLDHRGTLVGVMTLLGPSGTFPLTPSGREGTALREAAQAASREMGHAA
jgi:DNA-binding IclR family transcriptional regulator